MKTEYISPEFLFIGVELYDVLLSSAVEDYSSTGDDNGGSGSDWGDDPIFDDPGDFDDDDLFGD